MSHVQPQNSQPTAFVLNVATSGLAAMRSLGRAGVLVIGIDPDTTHTGFASRYGNSLVSPHPVEEPELLAEFLLDQASSLDQAPILSPSSDATVLFVSRFRAQLSERFRFIIPPANVLEAVVDKRSFYDLCARHDVNTTATFYPESMDDVRALRHELPYPAFIKPRYSHLWQKHFPGSKGLKVFDADQLVEHYERIFHTGLDVMVQSIIQGPASNVRTVYMYIDQQDQLLGHLTTRKIRQFPVEFGRGSLAETFHDADFANLGLHFFRSIGYKGFGTIEFKRDDRDGAWKATDLNARWVGPLQLPITAGVDFPLLHYRDLAGQHPSPQTEYKNGVRWLNSANDLASSWWNIRHDTLSVGDWLRSYRGVRAHATLSLDDPKPFLKEYDYGRKLLRIPLNAWRQR